MDLNFQHLSSFHSWDPFAASVDCMYFSVSCSHLLAVELHSPRLRLTNCLLLSQVTAGKHAPVGTSPLHQSQISTHYLTLIPQILLLLTALPAEPGPGEETLPSSMQEQLTQTVCCATAGLHCSVIFICRPPQLNALSKLSCVMRCIHYSNKPFKLQCTMAAVLLHTSGDWNFI